MKISMTMSYSGGFKESARQVPDLERAGLDQIFVPEPYSFDAISQVGYLAAITERIEIGTGVVNVFSRTAALMAMTAAGCDYVSDGRFVLGLGASGPQVVEGFHGMPFVQPMQRIIEYIEACRTVWRREEPFRQLGRTVQVPLPEGAGTGLGKALKMINHPVRSEIPIWWASLKERSVEATAAVADGWLPLMFVPEKWESVWGSALRKGLERRPAERGRLDIAAGGLVAIGEHLVGATRNDVLDQARPNMALYVGGMGARGQNFYNDVARAYGYEKEAEIVQDLYLAGRKDEAAAAIPQEWLELSNFVGPEGFVRERVAAYAEAGVTVLMIRPAGPDPVADVERMRSIVDGA